MKDSVLVKLVSGALITLLVAGTAGAQQDAALSKPEQDYMLYCMGCHQRDGTGAGEQVPALTGIDRFARFAEGREYLVRVPGVANAGLSDQRLAALLNWTLRTFGEPGFIDYTAGEVGRLRDSPFMNAVEAREAVAAALAESGAGAGSFAGAAKPR